MKMLIVVVAALVAAPAGAQSLLPGPNQTGRYEMQPIEGGVARLDTVTGDVSLCRVEGGTLRCRPSEDDNAAAAATPGGDEEQSARAPRDEESGDFADARPKRDPDAADEAETDRQLDKAMDRLKRAFRAFNDIAREFEGDKERGPHTPDRT